MTNVLLNPHYLFTHPPTHLPFGNYQFTIVRSLFLSWSLSFFPLHSFLKMFIYFWEGERERAGGGAEKEKREKIPSRFSAVRTEPDVGLDLMILGSWPELKSRVRRLTNWATPGTPHLCSFVLFLKFHMSEIIRHLSFSDWLTPLALYSIASSMLLQKGNFIIFHDE